MKVLILLTVIFTTFGCSQSIENDQVLILKLMVEKSSDGSDAVFFKTLDKDVVVNFLGIPIDEELFLRGILFPKSEVLYYFDQKTLANFSAPLNSYRTLPINTLNLHSVKLVNDEDIPDYVRFQQLTPKWEVDFRNVVFFSTPLVSGNKAVILSRSFTSHGHMDLHFLIKTREEWSWLGKTSISSISNDSCL